MSEAPVVAVAVVRSRDGRSVLDRAAGESAARYAADPDRLHATVAALTAHELSVDSVGRTAVWFSGRRAAVEATFAVTLTEADPTQSADWIVAGSPVFDATAGPIGSLVHRVVLVRGPELMSKPETGAFAVDGDLLLGEVGTTVVRDEPVRATGGTFPANAMTDLPARTVDSLATWREDPLFQALRAHLGERDPDSTTPATVLLAIHEYGGRPGLGGWFGALSGDRHVPFNQFGDRIRFPSVASLAVSVKWYADRAREVDDQLTWVRSVLRSWQRVRPDLRDTAGARDHLLSTAHLHNHLWVQSTLAAMETWLRGTHDEVPWPYGGKPTSPGDWPAATVSAVYDAIAQSHLETAADRLDALQSQWRLPTSTAAEEARTALLAAADDQTDSHAAMVANIALAMVAPLVDVALVSGRIDAGRLRGVATRAEHARTVASLSSGISGDPAVPGATVDESLLLDTALRPEGNPDLLMVVAVGNNWGPGRTWPSVTARRAAFLPNALVVGGVTPAGQTWTASPATHGYRFHDEDTRTYATIPTLCAVVPGDEGGGVWYPYPPAVEDGGEVHPAALTRWHRGSGSSQATPVVAAVAALVWSVFPGLSGDKVQAAVRAAAKGVDSGRFHIPSQSGGTTLPDADRLRVTLAQALANAWQAENVELVDELAGLLQPLRGTS